MRLVVMSLQPSLVSIAPQSLFPTAKNWEILYKIQISSFSKKQNTGLPPPYNAGK